MFAGFRRPNFSALKAGCKYPDAHNTFLIGFKRLGNELSRLPPTARNRESHPPRRALDVGSPRSPQSTRILKMSGSTNDPTATPSEPTSTIPNPIHEQLGLIYQKFRSLRGKFEQFAPWNPSYPIVPVDMITAQRTWNEALSRLQFHILPLLRHQISTLPKLLNPSELRDDVDGSKLQLITEIQAELDQSTNQILTFAAGANYMADDTSPAQADDRDWKELKQFRRRGLSFRLRCLLNHPLRFTFDLCYKAMKELQNPTTNAISHEPPHPNRKPRYTIGIVERTAFVTRSIDRVIRWITCHEFILVQEQWGTEVSAFDDQIGELTFLISRATHPSAPNNYTESTGLAARSLINEHAIPLAQSLIPAIKLSRLFFRKLTKNALNKIPSKSFTDMNSFQLVTLSDSPGLIECDFSDIMRCIAEYDVHNGYDEPAPEPIEDIIHKITQSFDSIILLVIIYVIPLIPDSLSSPNHLQTSIIKWKNLFLIAAHNCLRAAQSYYTQTHE
ncbi:hypothetical protein PCASD_07442 [Puccinia coronata f. sp. avenae]|uniref:Uncharacterized protein n=1 Tax=Puccinia coronata f. sp. avenae TaxID=200324 RepID=A0A2N5TG87_9BASI|nr:hypothetical protein PCASD_07442 [Puccinia coronata f. sp. avenae]